MIEQIFSKFVWPFALILGLVYNPAYIQLGSENLIFDYETGDNTPLYYLSIKNIGGQKARFDVSANVPWIFVNQEGYDNVKNIQLEREYTVNFVLNIRQEMVKNGKHFGEVTVEAINLGDQSVLDSKKVSVILNKNYFAPAPSSQTSPLPQAEETTPTPTLVPIKSPTISVQPIKTILPPQPTVTVKSQPKPGPTQTTPSSTVQTSPSPNVVPTKSPAETIKPTNVIKKESFIKRMWSFFRDKFF